MIKNTNKFRQAAIFFQKYGYYTSAPKGTTSYKQYWDEETKRCLNGWTADDGDYITGYNYFYLNYSPIQQVTEEIIKVGESEERVVAKRTKDFPKFYDSDYKYFLYVEEAERAGKHCVVLKKRRAGYSFKNASMLCRNFFLIPGSLSLAVAGEAEFLTKDGILSKAWDLMAWLDDNTAWTKKRQKTDTKMHKRASYIIDRDGTKIEAGFLSEIMGVTVKNDVNKLRGKAAKLIVFEESGKLPGLKEAWTIARPSVEQGSNVFGLLIAFGTGGGEDSDYEGLKALFYEPNAYNILTVDNIWETDTVRQCGFFVAEYDNMEGQDDENNPFMDSQGNSNKDIAVKYILKNRQKVIDNASDKNAIDRYIAEHPITPSEAFLTVSGNIFPKKELLSHLSYIKNSDSISNIKQVGDLQFVNGIIQWVLNPNLKSISKYRLSRDDSKEGAITIWEHPMSNPPWGLYIAGLDSYDFDNAANSESLGSIFIYKRFASFEHTYDYIVAEYTGRPNTADEFYESCRKLLMYYNAQVLYENQNPGVKTYFTNKHCEHLLADQPDIISKIIKNSTVNRGKGIHMTSEIKKWAEIKVRDWLIEEYEPGKKNLTKIYSEALIEELISFNDKGNFDRVSALFPLFCFKEELYNRVIKNKESIIKSKLLFETPLFTNREFITFR